MWALGVPYRVRTPAYSMIAEGNLYFVAH
jgi:hypothetical protein